MDTALNRRHPNRKIQKTTRYEPIFQGKRHKVNNEATLLKYGDNLLSTRTAKDEIEQVLGVNLYQQYNIKASLKRFVEKGGNAVTSELDQLNEMKTFAPIDSNRLTKKDMSEVLAYLMLLTEKGI